MRRLLRWALRAAFASGIACLFGWFGLRVAARAGAFPRADSVASSGDSIRIHAADGRLIRERVNGEGVRVEWTPLDRISPRVVDATIAVEDARFFEHDGVDGRAVVRAIAQAVRARRVVSGASTLSMQLARLIHPHEKSMRGKLGEMIDALRLEATATKPEILEQYLNRASYGAGTIGVEAASRRYFGKPSAHLSLAEAALLAGLPQAPSNLSPLKDMSAAAARRRTVLRRLGETGRATQEEVARAFEEPIMLASRGAANDGARGVAMHFTELVAANKELSGDVATSLDLDLQLEAERMVREHVEKLASRGVKQAAVVVLDNARCDILAMVGSPDYFAQPNGAVNGATARRQPGSTLKPFTYALAFERGFTPASTIADVKTRFGEAAGALYSPKNYAGELIGPTTMDEALARSLNVPAVRTASLVGTEALLEELHQLGFESLDHPASHYGLGLTLGNGEVTLLELARAYAALARGGRACGGDRRVFSEQVASMVTAILADVPMRVLAFGPNNALLLPFPVAAKTGTSTDFRDSWAIGYTARFTVAVWAGDFEGRPMNHVAGVAGAGPLFHGLMARVVARDAKHPPRLLPAPEGVVEVTVCATSGRRPTKRCPRKRTISVPTDRMPEDECPHHQELPIDRRNGFLAGENCPEEFVERRVYEVLPAEYAEWQAEQAVAPPQKYSPHCPKSGGAAGQVVITYPRKGEVFLFEPGYDPRAQVVALEAEVDPPAPDVTWYIDGNAIARAEWPYRGSWPIARGRHRLEVEAEGRRSRAVEFEVR